VKIQSSLRKRNTKHVNSFVQKHLRALRDGTTDLYTTGAVNRMPKQKTKAKDESKRVGDNLNQPNPITEAAKKSFSQSNAQKLQSRCRNRNTQKAKALQRRQG
jgi:hypothetical protein